MRTSLKKIVSSGGTSLRRRHIFSSLTSLEGCTSIDEVAEKCGMDFMAEKRPQTYSIYDDEGDETEVENPTHDVILRKDTQEYLGTVGKTYEVVQYPEVFDFVQVLVDEDLAGFEYGGVSDGGKKAYIALKLSDDISFSPDVKIDYYFYVSTSHNGTASVNIIPAPLVDKGNIVLLMPKISAIKFKHTKKVANRMAYARRTIGSVKEYKEYFEKSFINLASIRLDKNILDTYLFSIFPDPKKNPAQAEKMRDKVKYIMSKEAIFQVPATNNTLLGAYFAVCMFADFFMSVRKRNNKDEVSAKIESSLDVAGAGAKRKAEALAFALKLSKGK